jgi:hypothetical protein
MEVFLCFTTHIFIMWSSVSQLKLSANDEKYPHVINVDKGNSEDCQQEESVEASLADSLEGNSARFAQLQVRAFALFFSEDWLEVTVGVAGS